MTVPAGLDLADIPERIQSEVQRAIQRSIKGVEYISTSGPSMGSTPKDILAVRGTMNLYHYRPVADEIYRVPVLIVMARLPSLSFGCGSAFQLISRAQGCSKAAFVHQKMQHFASRATACPSAAGAEGTRRTATVRWCALVHLSTQRRSRWR